MPRYIVKLETQYGPRYLEYSTIVDAPVTYGLPREEFEAYYLSTYGKNGDLAARMRRVDAKGTSSEFHTSAWDTMRLNRAGRNETCLSMTQLIDWYCDRRDEHGPHETDGDQPLGVPHGDGAV